MEQARALAAALETLHNMAPTLSIGLFSGYSETELNRGIYRRSVDSPEQKQGLWRRIRRQLDFAVLGRYNHHQPSDDPLVTSRNQVLGSVLLESLVIGVLASIVGLLLGLLLAKGMDALSAVSASGVVGWGRGRRVPSRPADASRPSGDQASEACQGRRHATFLEQDEPTRWRAR